MTEILLISMLIIAISLALLSVKVIFRRNGEFTSQHIHDSEAMRERGKDLSPPYTPCVIEQDREERTNGHHLKTKFEEEGNKRK